MSAVEKSPQPASEATLRRLLQWSAEDLNDPAIRRNPARLAAEREAAVKRLAPHIEQVVALAWAQVQIASPSDKEAP